MAHHVPDGEPDGAIGQRHHVEPVAPDLRPVQRRQVGRGDVQAGDGGHIGQQAVLQRERRRALPQVEPHVVEREGGPLADVRRCHHVLGREAVHGVVQKAQGADEVVAGAQRHGQRGAQPQAAQHL